MSKEIKKVDDAALAIPEDVFSGNATGFEDVDNECISIPYLVVLQKGSPQCDDADGEYLPEARPGMFFNSATKQLYKDPEGLLLLPCHMNRRFVEWVPKEEGGGFRGDHDPADVDVEKLERDASGRFVLGNGNYLADTRYHYCLLLDGDSVEPVVLSLSSTQIKKSKSWITAMRSRKVKNPATGKLQTVPMMANVWRVKAVAESNDKGSWKGYAFSFERTLDFQTEGDLYELGKELHSQVVSGQAKVAQETEDDDMKGEF